MNDVIDKNEIAIWWVNQSDCQLNENNSKLETLPEYILSEFNGRCGRPGRGRLWVPETIKINSVEVPSTVVWESGDTHGGIVILKEHILLVKELNGIVSDAYGNVL